MADFCSAGKSGVEYLGDFQFMEAISCTYIDAVGLFVVGTLVLAPIFAVTYIRTGSPVIPFVMLLVTGGTVMSVVAAPVVGLATVLLLLVGGGVVAYAYWQWSV